jgi:putative membrane-bound dehydrogenase-like protein
MGANPRIVVSMLLVAIVAGSSFPPPMDAQKPNSNVAPKLPRIAPKEPADSIKSFQTRDGFRMELLAAEPLLTSPVVVEYDEFGRAWVLEMRDYPYTDKANDKPFADNPGDLPLGRIRILEDTKGAGVFDKSTIFADNLSWPTGLAFWKGGVLVAATPDIWYLKDTDGDGKADIREKVFTGFRKYNIQAVINNLKWGLDHRIYGAGGANGGRIQNVKNPEAAPVTLSANDFRIDPATNRFELQSGGQRFGNAFDDWGNRFLCNIRNPVIHVALPSHYLARNPFLPVAKALHDAAEAGDTLPVYRISPSEPWRALRAERWAKEPGQTMPRSELVADGYFTSACGITIYRGDAYPDKYRGNIFLAEVSANLIHRELLTPQGVTFKAARAEQKTEFAASTDIWFRPVNFVNAPDGTLHVVDMYRETIEHPWSIPDDIKAELDLENGRDRGRLWRLAPPGFKWRETPRLGDLSAGELVELLEHPNAWHRETAHRLIFERQDRSAAKALRQLLLSSQSPLGRAHALWSLDGLAELTSKDLELALKDDSAGVREHAVRLSEGLLPSSEAVRERVLAMISDASPRVRFQVALTLGEMKDERATAALAQLLRRDGDNPWARAALLSSVMGRADRLLTDLTRSSAFAASDTGRVLVRSLAQMIGARNERTELESAMALLAGNAELKETSLWQSAILFGLGQGLKANGRNLSKTAQELHPAAAKRIAALLAAAHGIVSAEQTTPEQREQAVQLLSFGEIKQVTEPLLAGLDARQPQVVQFAAIRALSSFADQQVAPLLLERYRTLTPPLRAEAIEALLARPERIAPLLDALENKKIASADVPVGRKAMLMRHANASIRERANTLFKAETLSPRRDVIAQYQKALDLKPDAKRGKLVFERECAACHRLGDVGHEVGPNLESVRHHTPSQMLTNILDPNREVSPNYVEFTIATNDGKVATGRISAETATSITLLRPGNVQETILRQSIEEITSSGRSLMPEGLEQKLTHQEMADVIGYVLGR